MALTRKSWLWRIGSDDENEKINAFLDAQPNIAESMKTLVLYAQSRFGNRNITLSNIREILSKDVLLNKDGKSVATAFDNKNNNREYHNNQNQKDNHRLKNTDDKPFDNEDDNRSVNSNSTKENNDQSQSNGDDNETVDYSKVDVTRLF